MRTNVKRTFVVGDDWIYYKIYTGPKMADSILTDIINPVAKELLQNGHIDQWFFIRYADPKHHLRVRFHLTSSPYVLEIITKLNLQMKWYLEQDIIWKIQLDTYNRELERYGHNTIDFSENIFFHDSKMISDFVGLIKGDKGEEIRWLFGLRSIESLINSFNYSDKEKMDLLEVLKTHFGNEFNMSRPLKKQLDDKYRFYRKKISDFMNLNRNIDSDYAPLIDLLDLKTENIKKAVSEILSCQKKGTLAMELNEFLGSHIHMLMNRLFKSNNRIHEMVCYDFLYRYYRSKLARQKYQVNLDAL